MEPRQSCVARMLDVRGMIMAARHAVAGLDAGPALLMACIFGLIGLCLLPFWISFDLASTWEFTTALRAGAEPVISQATAQAGDVLGLTLAQLLAGVILTSFTLLPSLFELAFPTVAHPLLNLVLWGSILFDYTTDWAKAWETTAEWTNNPALHTVYAAGFCLFVSLIVQALLAISLTVVLFAILAVLRGPARVARQAVVMEQRP